MLGLSRPTIRSDLSLLVMLHLLDAKPKVGYFLGSSSTSSPWSQRRLNDVKVKAYQAMPVVIRETASVSDAVVTLFLENVGSLIVTDPGGALVGVVSRKDLLKVTLGNATASSMPVSLVMTRQPNIITVSPDDSVIEAARLMLHHEVDSLPIVQRTDEGTDEVVGRITKTTMTKILLDHTIGMDV